MKTLYCFIFFVSCLLGVSAQQASDLKSQAKEEFRKEHYPGAIELLKQAQKLSPQDAEIYYLLGFYTHYNAYDSRPLQGYGLDYSQQVFGYLDKALELNPDYGDAKYFYGAECSANAFVYMQRYQADSLRAVYKKAYDKGAYPGWLLELGRNRLDQCDRDAILFAAGNADFDVSMYLQLHENYRKDITVVPIGNIDRPWYVEFLKKGLPGAVRSVEITLSAEQIHDMHPYKWDTTVISIPVPSVLRKEYGMGSAAAMDWTVVPDYVSGRNNQQDASKKQGILSPQRAVLLHIVEVNAWRRPVFFSRGMVLEFMGGLDEYCQDCGLVNRLLPVKTKGTHMAFDPGKIEKLIMNPDHLKFYPTVRSSDIPRVSGVTTLYHVSAYVMAQIYAVNGDRKKLDSLLDIYERYLSVGLYPETEDFFRTQIRQIIKEENDKRQK